MPKVKPLFEQTDAFESGAFVKNINEVFGTVQSYDPSLHPSDPKSPGKDGPEPFGMENKVKIPPGMIGEVLSSDGFNTVVIFPINSTGNLQPQLIKVQGFTSDFKRVVRKPEQQNINPFIGPDAGRRKDRAQNLSPAENQAFGDKIISKWEVISNDQDYVKDIIDEIFPYLDDLEMAPDPNSPYVSIILDRLNDLWNLNKQDPESNPVVKQYLTLAMNNVKNNPSKAIDALDDLYKIFAHKEDAQEFEDNYKKEQKENIYNQWGVGERDQSGKLKWTQSKWQVN